MLLFVAAIFSFTACEKDNADDNSNDNTTTTTTTTTDESLKNTTWIYNASDPNAVEIINVFIPHFFTYKHNPFAQIIIH